MPSWPAPGSFWLRGVPAQTGIPPPMVRVMAIFEGWIMVRNKGGSGATEKPCR